MREGFLETRGRKKAERSTNNEETLPTQNSSYDRGILDYESERMKEAGSLKEKM